MKASCVVTRDFQGSSPAGSTSLFIQLDVLHSTLDGPLIKTEAMGRNSQRMKRQKQYAFKGEGLDKPKDWFGGATIGKSCKTNPKTKRPLSSKLPIHLTLRTDTKNSMRKPKAFGLVHRIMVRTMKKHGVTLYDYSNVGNHLHILMKISHVRRWPAFIRELTGRLSQEMQGLKGPQKGERYWAYRPHTRIVQGWKKAFKIVKEYIYLNDLEAEGFISRRDFKRLADLRAFLGHA